VAEDTEGKNSAMHWIALFWIGSGLMMILDGRIASRQDMTLLVACVALTALFAILGVGFSISAVRRMRRATPGRPAAPTPAQSPPHAG
jgi:hypothetical protein